MQFSDLFAFDFDFSLFDLKPGSKKELEIIDKLKLRSKYFELFEYVLGMFTYNGLPWRKEFLEVLWLRYGWAAVGRNDDGVHVGWIAYEDRDENGIPIGQATLTTVNGYEMQGEIDKNIVIGYNNDLRMPELMISEYAEMFTETDKSIRAILDKARLLPIPITKDSKVKAAIDESFKDIKLGNLKAVAYDGIKDDFAGDGDPVQMLELTQPEHTDKLQYMSKFYDDLLRRFFTKYGHQLSSASKMAQVSTAELEGYATMSRIYPYILLNARRDMCERCNKILGTDISVDFSEAWQHLKNPIVLTNEADNIEEV